MLKRKIYDTLVAWKNSSKGTTTMMIDGARRVGKALLPSYLRRRNHPSASVYGRTAVIPCKPAELLQACFLSIPADSEPQIRLPDTAVPADDV